MRNHALKINNLLLPLTIMLSVNGFAADPTISSAKPHTIQKALGENIDSHEVRRSGAHGRNDPHVKLTPEKHIQVALQHKAEGRLAEAFTSLNQAIRSNPLSAELLAVRGSFYLEQQDVSSALRDFESAIKISPDSAAILTNRAQAYRHFGRIAEALADLNKAIDLNPDLMPAYFNRGAIHYSSGEFDRALKDFDTCIAINPHAAGPYFNRASAKQALGDHDGAIRDIKYFMEMTADNRWKQIGQELLEKWQGKDTSGNG